jgi:hypothetical protein
MVTTFASNQTFVFAAYALTWAVVLGYGFGLVRASARARATFAAVVASGAERSR